MTYDDGFDAKRTPDNVRKLVQEDKVFALFMVRGTPQNESYPAHHPGREGAAGGAAHRRHHAASSGQPLRIQRARQIPG
ncbi:hypothetical protein ACU4GD_03450 [Cupriavidus basilensis]